ncbi:MAG TPA: YegP family protein [Polyangia bacterium]|nr:YegP family protein [Polyangia bacterium]
MPQRQYRIERWQSSKNGQFYWHLRAPNGRIQCQGEGHPHKLAIPRAAKRIAKVLPTAVLVDVTEAEAQTGAPTVGGKPKLPRGPR